MRANAPVIFKLSYRQRTFPCLDVANKNITGFDKKGLLPCDLIADKRGFVESAAPE